MTVAEASSSAQLVAELLRTRRERLTPRDVGLPAGNRRRTKGLRREEVAQLANISATYYTFLEQGRDIHPSVRVLDSLASALRFDRAERSHLHRLAGGVNIEAAPETEDLAAGLADLVGHLDPRPTYVTGRYFDVLAANRAARSLWTDWNALPEAERNLLWWVFTAPAARTVLVDWEAEASSLLVNFRTAASRHPRDLRFGVLVERLHAVSPEVREWWPRHDLVARRDDTLRLHHHEVGTLELHQTVLQVADELDQKLVTFAVDEHDRERIAALVEDFSLGVVVRAD